MTAIANHPSGSMLPPHRIVWASGLVLLAAYVALWALVPADPALLAKLWFLPGVGIIGAIIANTSGTGGGVVFVPVFNALRELGVMSLSPLMVVGVSMGIQSFGMTMGSLRWTDRLLHQPEPGRLEARVRIDRLGGRTAYTSGGIWHAEEQVATMSGVFAIRR